MPSRPLDIGFLTMEKYENRRKDSVGSSRIRGRWVMKYCEILKEFRNGRTYDAVIYQKAYWKEHIDVFDGVKIFDLCDPDWLDGRPLLELSEQIDAFTVPTVALRDYMAQMLNKPVYIIPDRIDPDEHTPVKLEHVGKARTAVWFGYSQNHKVLDPVVDSLHNRGIKLVCISDRNYFQADVNLKYDYQTLNQDLIKYDFAVMPTLPDDFRFHFKSNNKDLTCWALGLPVAKSGDDVERFMDPAEREKESLLRREEVLTKYHSKLSGDEYLKIISEIYAKKKGGE